VVVNILYTTYKETLDHLCNGEVLIKLLRINEAIFTVSILQNSMNHSHVLCPVVLFYFFL